MENRSITQRLFSLTAITLIINGAISPAFARITAHPRSSQSAKSTPVKSTADKSDNFRSIPVQPSIPKAESISRAQVTNTAVEAWRKDAPKMSAPRPFNLPEITSYKLENGLEVQLVEDHRYPFISATIGFRDGTSNEPKDMLGLADMTADLLTEGTTTRKSKEIASEIDFIGGGLAASTDYDYTILSGSALSPYTGRLFEVLADVLLHPSFPENELALKKVNQIQALTIKRGNPEFLVEERFNKVLFGEHPYSVIAPPEESLNKITRKDIEAYHKAHYQPNHSVMVVVGDFDKTKMRELIASKFGDQWKASDVPVAAQPEMPKQSGRRIYLVDRPGSVQTSIKVGNVGVKRSDPDYFAMVVMNQILGGAAHARLFLNIREAKGYTYGAYSRMAARKQPGTFFAGANVRTEVTNPSLQEFLYELDRMRTTKVTDAELKSAQNYLAGSFQLGLETQSGLAQRLLEAKLYDLPDDFLKTYADKVTAVKVDDVRAAARKLIDSNNLVVAAVGDAKKIRSDLELFGPVTVYDAQGKLSSISDEKKSQ
jgi:zinc protease